MNSVEKVLRGAFADSGWDGLEAKTDELTAEAQHANSLKRFESSMDIARPFMTTDGKVALAALRRMTVESPTWSPEATGAMEGAAAGFAREGQDSIIRHIERCIDIALEGPPSITTGADTP